VESKTVRYRRCGRAQAHFVHGKPFDTVPARRLSRLDQKLSSDAAFITSSRLNQSFLRKVRDATNRRNLLCPRCGCATLFRIPLDHASEEGTDNT
jgi:hypothetical protein